MRFDFSLLFVLGAGEVWRFDANTGSWDSLGGCLGELNLQVLADCHESRLFRALQSTFLPDSQRDKSLLLNRHVALQIATTRLLRCANRSPHRNSASICNRTAQSLLLASITATATRVAVDLQGQPWAVDTRGELHQWSDERKAWVQPPKLPASAGVARDIAIGSESSSAVSIPRSAESCCLLLVVCCARVVCSFLRSMNCDCLLF